MKEQDVFADVEGYELWFKENDKLYMSELDAIRRVLPKSGQGVEIGSGSGLFAFPLGIKIGIEPSPQMRKKARERGIETLEGVAESLPVPDAAYDFALMVTADCFLRDIRLAFLEIRRILKKEGFLIIAFLDRAAPLGQAYEQKKQQSIYYKNAQFHSSEEITAILQKTGFAVVEKLQTVFSLRNEPQQIIADNGEGLFAIIKAIKV